MLSLHARVRKADQQLTSEIDGKVVLLGLEAGKYFMFDAISSDIWQRLEQQPRLDALCEALARDYDADLATIQGDVCRLIEQLAARQLLHIVDDAQA